MDGLPLGVLEHIDILGDALELEVVALHFVMQRQEFEGIPEYINMLEDAQLLAGQAGRTIVDETLLLFASTAMLTSERFPHANDNWGSAQSETRRGQNGIPHTSGLMTRQ